MYKYNEMRDLIQDGDVVFFNTPSLLGRFIRLFSKRFNHVGVATWGDVVGVDRLFILEETPAGRQLCNMSNRCSKVTVYRVPDTFNGEDDDEDPIWDALTLLSANTGAPYSMWNAVVGGLGLPLSWRNSKGNICSQLSADFIYEACGMLVPDQHPSKQEKFCAKYFTEVTPQSSLLAG